MLTKLLEVVLSHTADANPHGALVDGLDELIALAGAELFGIVESLQKRRHMQYGITQHHRRRYYRPGPTAPPYLVDTGDGVVATGAQLPFVVKMGWHGAVSQSSIEAASG